MTRKQNKKITTLGKNLGNLLARRQWGHQQHLFDLDRNWRAIVGAEIAGRSMPAFFRRDVLWIYVQGSIWMQQLQFAKLDLLDRINDFLRADPKVTDLRWMEYPPDLKPLLHRPYVSPPISVDPEAEQDFKSMAENITDPETRKAFHRLWLLLRTKNRGGIPG
jgi:hypothetical protein